MSLSPPTSSRSPALPASARRGSAPVCERLADALPIPTWLFGLGISAALLLSMTVVELWLGELAAAVRGETPEWKSSEYRFSVVFALLAGYLPAAYVWTVHASRRAFAELRPALRGTHAELDALAAQLGRFDARAHRRAGLAGVAVAVLLPVAVDLSPRVYGIPAWTDLNTAAFGHRLLVPILFWLLARIVHAQVVDSRRLAVASRERLELDLLDLAPLAPLTRYGLRNALVTLGAFAIVSLMLVDLTSRPGLPWVLAGVFALAIASGTTGLLLPVRGARNAIRDRKGRELSWCRREIRRRREALADGRPGEGASLDELVAYHGLVQSVREWPFDAPTLLRFVLYLAIPLGSWLGGAMVERLLDVLLG